MTFKGIVEDNAVDAIVAARLPLNIFQAWKMGLHEDCNAATQMLINGEYDEAAALLASTSPPSSSAPSSSPSADISSSPSTSIDKADKDIDSSASVNAPVHWYLLSALAFVVLLVK